MVSDCSIKVENEKTQPDSSSVIVPDGSQASIELCTQGGGGLAEDDDGDGDGDGDGDDAAIEPVLPVPIPLWVLLLMIAGTPYLVWRKS
jgi:hypothetical protein